MQGAGETGSSSQTNGTVLATARRMRYRALACDYDGTLAEDGSVAPATLDALRRLRQSGRRLILVSGRELEDLQKAFGSMDLFDRAVLENGALLYRPADGSVTMLADPPPPGLVELLQRRGVSPLSQGHAILATWEPFEGLVLEAIHDLGLEMQIIFNKGAVMVLPSGVNKGTGLCHALEELGLSTHEVAGIGDAENDHAFLACCECAAVVDNAVPLLKQRADLVTKGARGSGVVELVERLLADDLAGVQLPRHDLLLGRDSSGEDVRVPAYGSRVLVAGHREARSRLSRDLMGRLAVQGYQFCLLDPEGEHGSLAGCVHLGDVGHSPGVDEVLHVLEQPRRSATVDLSGANADEQRALFSELLLALSGLGRKAGRPHWLALDEAERLVPAEHSLVALDDFAGVLLATERVDDVSVEVLQATSTMVAAGDAAVGGLAAFARIAGHVLPAARAQQLRPNEAAVWQRSAEARLKTMMLEPEQRSADVAVPSHPAAR